MKTKLLLISMMFSLVSIAQDESVGPISTDRPVQSESPTVVPKKYLQFEEGIYFEKGIQYISSAYEYRTDQLNYNLLIKYGLIKNLEFRFNFDYLHSETTDKIINEEEQSSGIGGVGGPNIGFKYSFLQDDRESWKPNLTLSVHSQFDWWGRDAYKPDNGNVSFRLTAGKNITENWYFIGGFGINFEDGNSDATGQFYVLQTGYTFFGKLTAVAELYGNRNDNIDLNQNAINGGLVYLINDNHQIDISGGMGLDNDWYSYYLAFGYSFRLKT